MSRPTPARKTKPVISAWLDPRTVVAIVSVFVAAGSIYVARQALKVNERVVAVSTYMELRNNFNQIRDRIPNKYFRIDEPAPSKSDDAARRAISAYWYLAFDEWWITTQLGGPTLRKLWKARYSHLIQAQLEKRAFREVACDLINEKFVGNKTQQEFARELAELYHVKANQPLCLP